MSKNITDDLSRLGIGLDWITPLLAEITDLLNGPVAHFGVSANTGWNRPMIKRLLNQHGIKVWGLMYAISDGYIMFAVKKCQAGRVWKTLIQNGIPVLYGPKKGE